VVGIEESWRVSFSLMLSITDSRHDPGATANSL
jgi:hypothetical protein